MSGRKDGDLSGSQGERRRAREMRADGVPVREIAKVLGRSRATIYSWTSPRERRAPVLQLYVDSPHSEKEEKRESAVDIITRHSSDAALVIVELMMDADAPPSVRFRAASTILDRVGIIPPRRSEVQEDPVDAGPDLSDLTDETVTELWNQIEKSRGR